VDCTQSQRYIKSNQQLYDKDNNWASIFSLFDHTFTFFTTSNHTIHPSYPTSKMQFSYIFLILAPIIAAQAAPEYCAKRGAVMGDGQKNAARGWVDQLCNVGGLSGSFNSNQAKKLCKRLNPAQTAISIVEWTGVGSISLNDADCKLRLYNLINGCERGGYDNVADWYFQ
jgi:hypothetical protein